MYNQDEASCREAPASGHLFFPRSPAALSVDLSLDAPLPLSIL